jgi:glycosyltransferase involved in cell wall biosynthesis
MISTDDHVDVVDTGSTDRTIEIAENFFAAHPEITGKIHHFPWIDHFGKAKTYALRRSQEAGCKVITFLDADEEVWFENTQITLSTPEHRREHAATLVSRCSNICQLQTVVDGNLRWWRFYAVNASLTQLYWAGKVLCD